MKKRSQKLLEPVCPYCDKRINRIASARFLEAQINPFKARLISVSKKNSQGWFYWHPSCAEKSIGSRP